MAVAATLDSALKTRLREVLERQQVTEAELRKLFEEGQACALILGGELEKAEQRLVDLAADPAAPLAEMAASLRALNDLRPDLEELHELLDELSVQARRFRASWLSARQPD